MDMFLRGKACRFNLRAIREEVQSGFKWFSHMPLSV